MPLLFRTALVNDLGAQYEVERDDPSTNGKLLAQASKQASKPRVNRHPLDRLKTSIKVDGVVYSPFSVNSLGLLSWVSLRP